MNNKHREILRIHRSFLIHNIIWTDTLQSKLTEQGLLPDSQLREIQKVNSRDEKVGKLLDILPLQGIQAYDRLGDVLQSSGHFFLADFLRNEDILSEKLILTDSIKKFPFIGNRLQVSEKKELENYLQEKFKTESLRQLWRNDFREKEKALEARSKQLEQAYDFENERRRKQEEIKNLELKLEDSRKETENVRAQISGLNQKIREMEEKYKNVTTSQLKFNEANESVLQRTSDRLENSEKLLMDIHVKVVKNLHEQNKPKNARDEMALQIDKFKYIMTDLDDFIKQYQGLLIVRDQYEELSSEKDYVMTHLGHNPSSLDCPNLKTAYRDFIAKNEEKLTEMKEKLSEYGDLLEEHKSSLDAKKKFQAGAGVWQSAIMNVMRNQLNDLKQQHRIKDTRLQMYETDAAKLKAKVSELEREVRNTNRSQQDRNTGDKLTVVAHNRVHSNMSMRSCLSDELDGMSDYKGEVTKKQTHLPPIPVPRTISPGGLSPRKSHPKPVAYAPKKPVYTTMPNGLVTSQVKFESRQKHAVHGLGDLKALHLHSKSKFEKTLSPAKVNL